MSDAKSCVMDVRRLDPMTLDEAWEFDRLVQMALAEVGVHATAPTAIESRPDGLGPHIERIYLLSDWEKVLRAKRLAFDAMGVPYEEVLTMFTNGRLGPWRTL